MKELSIVKQMVADGQISQEVAEKYFPELKESEDERIRKELLDYLMKFIPHNDLDLVRKSKVWIAWLENQGEHTNFLNKIQVGDKVTRNKDGMLVNLSQLDRIAKKDEKQGEKKPQRIVSAEAKEAMYDMLAWSEEEGRMLDEMYEFFDKRKFPSLKHCMDDYAKLIKFLKERVQLQNHWKPSKEQMEALYEANTVMYGGGNYHLTSLYNDLKKLKE